MNEQSERTTRKEHLDWCKQRALEHIAAGNIDGAFNSFISDINKHPETASIGQLIVTLGMPLKVMGALDSPDEMRRHIEGYN